jgi:hypothetical protein
MSQGRGLPRGSRCLLAGVVLACSSEPNGFERGCDSQVSFTAGPGLTPQISWSPDCKLHLLRVTGPDGIEWQVRGVDQLGYDNTLTSPIVYGVLPADASSEAGPRPLVTGGQYGLQAWIVDLNTQVIGAGEGGFTR